MRNAYIRSFLVFIVLLQSFAAIADPHQFHQSNNQHDIISEHVHDQSAVDFIDITDIGDQQDTSFDCHHCCHCHGMISSALPVSAYHFLCIRKELITSSYTLEYSSRILGSLYRPPIV